MWSNDTPLHDGLYADRVHLSGRLSNNDIVEAMAGAEALVFVPWFEGFGIPLLEAMACEVPVIASNVTALPEVCGDAAFALVSPDSSEDIAEAMLRLNRTQRMRKKPPNGYLEMPSFFLGEDGIIGESGG